MNTEGGGFRLQIVSIADFRLRIADW